MNHEAWMNRVSEFVGEIEADKELVDLEFVGVMQELEEAAGAAWRAKQEESDGGADYEEMSDEEKG